MFSPTEECCFGCSGRASFPSAGTGLGRTGNCYDNAVMESFWGKLKSEMVFHERFATIAQARAAVFDYIEAFYNRTRIHATLGYLSPEQFEAARA